MSSESRSVASDYVRIVYESRYFVGGITIATFVVAAIAELTILRNDFAAEVVLVQTSPELGSEKMARLIPSAYHTKAYEELIMSTSVLGAVLDDAIEQGVWEDSGDIPELDELRLQLRTRTIVIDETTRPVNYAPFLRLRVTDKDPEIARRLADIWAEHAIGAANRSNELSIDTATETLRNQESDYRERLDEIWGEQAAEEAKWNIPVLKAELDNTVSLIDRLTERLLDANARIASEEERLRSIQAELAKENEFRFLFRAPSDDVYWLEELGGEPGQTPSGKTLEQMEGKGLVHQEVNPVYQKLKENEHDATSALASVHATASALKDQLGELETKREQMQTSIAEHELVQKRMARQSNVLNQIYQEIADLDSFVVAASELVRPREEDGTLTVGFNRLSTTTYVQEARGLTTGKVRVALVTIIASLLACAYVIGRVELPKWVNEGEATEPEPVPEAPAEDDEQSGGN